MSRRRQRYAGQNTTTAESTDSAITGHDANDNEPMANGPNSSREKTDKAPMARLALDQHDKEQRNVGVDSFPSCATMNVNSNGQPYSGDLKSAAHEQALYSSSNNLKRVKHISIGDLPLNPEGLSLSRSGMRLYVGMPSSGGKMANELKEGRNVSDNATARGKLMATTRVSDASTSTDRRWNNDSQSACYPLDGASDDPYYSNRKLMKRTYGAHEMYSSTEPMSGHSRYDRDQLDRVQTQRGRLAPHELSGWSHHASCHDLPHHDTPKMQLDSRDHRMSSSSGRYAKPECDDFGEDMNFSHNRRNEDNFVEPSERRKRQKRDQKDSRKGRNCDSEGFSRQNDSGPSKRYRLAENSESDDSDYEDSVKERNRNREKNVRHSESEYCAGKARKEASKRPGKECTSRDLMDPFAIEEFVESAHNLQNDMKRSYKKIKQMKQNFIEAVKERNNNSTSDDEVDEQSVTSAKDEQLVKGKACAIM